MVLFIFWLIIFVFVYYKYKNDSIYFIPIIFILNILSRQLISINQTENRYIILMEYSMLFFFLFLSFINLTKKKYRLDSVSRIILLFIIYLLIELFINSSDTWLSFKRSLPFITSLIIFTSLYNIYPHERYLKIVNKQLLYVLVLFAINVIILSGFRLGGQLTSGKGYDISYAAPFLRWGRVNMFEAQGIAIVTSLYFIINSFFNNQLIHKRILMLIFWVILIIFLLTAKRIYVLLPIVGLILSTFLLYRFKTSRNLILFSFLFIIIIAFFTLKPLYSSFIEVRSKSNDINTILNEGRIAELKYFPAVANSMDSPTAFTFFGTELFNSAGKFSILDEKVGYGMERFLHNDFSHILYGSGLVGLGLYLYILIKLTIISIRFYKYSKAGILFICSSGALVLLANLFIVGFDGGILNSANRIIPFFILGFYLSFLRLKYYAQKIY